MLLGCKTNGHKDIPNLTIHEKRMTRLLILLGFVSIVITTLGIHDQYYSNISMQTNPTPHRETTPYEEISFERPFTYPHRVDFRIIILTQNRTSSLAILLESIESLITYGDKVSIEIWIDRNNDDEVHFETLDLAMNFSRKNIYTNVHVHSKHVGLYGQWLLTYSSNHLIAGEDEIVLFLEDDLTLSKYGYKWLKAVHGTFRDEPNYLGTSLKSLEPVFPLNKLASSNHTIFMFRIFSTHGFSPKLKVWDNFQKWFVEHINRSDFKPYVPDIKPTAWYKSFELTNKTMTMWSIWFLYYTYIEQLFAVYPNSEYYKKFYNSTANNTMFTFLEHRCEPGLHYTKVAEKDKKSTIGLKSELIHTWEESFIEFPANISKYDWQGQLL